MNSADESINMNESEQDIKSDSTDSALSQLELIQQWRAALTCLKKDVEFDVKPLKDTEDEKITHVLDAVKYLDKKNTLLDENDDFQFSDTGFLAYKRKHMLVFDYLSTLNKPTPSNAKSAFYFISRNKHIAQELQPGNGMHSFIHFVLLLVVMLILGLIGWGLLKITQDNRLVYILLAWFCVVNFKTAKSLIARYRKTASTPFLFNVSLIGIHSVNVLDKVFCLCLLPMLLISKFNHYWVDDVIIISLFVICLINFKPTDEANEKLASKKLTEVESTNV